MTRAAFLPMFLLIGLAAACRNGRPVEDAVLVANQEPNAEALGSEPIEAPASFTSTELATGPNDLGLLVGGSTTNRAGGGFTLGVDYQYVPINLGAFVEYTVGDQSAWVAGAGLFFRPVDDFVVIVAPGFESTRGDEKWFGRLGVAYELPAGAGLTVAPALYGDFKQAGKFVLVFGLRLGTRF